MTNEQSKLFHAYGILRECLGDNGVWADPSRYARQCWTRDFGLAIQPLLLDLGETEIAARHLRNLEARQESDGRIPIVFLDGLAGHARFLYEKGKKSAKDGKLSFMLKRYLEGQLGQLTPGTRDSELLYIVAAYEHAERTGSLPVSFESVARAMKYIKRNLLDSRGLLLGADWRDTMDEQLKDKALLTNNALLYHAYDLMGYDNPVYGEQAERQRKLINETFWEGKLLQDWPGNGADAFASKQRFDPLGASLAVLYDIIPRERYADVWAGFASVDTAHGVTIKCRHNPVSAEEAEVIERTDGVVVWPFVVGFAVLAMRRMYDDTGGGPIGGASQQYEKLLKLDDFREWYDPATGKGYGAARQLWSATLFARAQLNLHMS